MKQHVLGALGHLDPTEIQRMVASAEEIVVGPGSTLHERSGSGRSHVILAGTASVEGGDGHQLVGPGTIIGELAEGDLRGARLTAVTLLHVLAITTPAHQPGGDRTSM